MAWRPGTAASGTEEMPKIAEACPDPSPHLYWHVYTLRHCWRYMWSKWCACTDRTMCFSSQKNVSSHKALFERSVWSVWFSKQNKWYKWMEEINVAWRPEGTGRPWNHPALNFFSFCTSVFFFTSVLTKRIYCMWISFKFVEAAGQTLMIVSSRLY